VAKNTDQCLVLNKSWVPIETITWQEAFTKIFNGRAYAVEYYEEMIKTPTDEFLKPAVIVCTEFNKIPVRAPIYSKRMVYVRDNYTCQYCRKKLTSGTATIDHVHPRSKGGRSTFKNTVCACEKCNSKKADKTLKESGMRLLKKPEIPRINPIKARFARTKMRDEWKTHLEPYVG
jgi:5-methylcytosine-specific restriction endonuclease McrA